MYYKVTNLDGDMIFSTTIENDAYLFVINLYLDNLRDNINYYNSHIYSFANEINTINQTIDAINNKEYESAYFFCKDYMGFNIETEDINVSIPIITPKMIKDLNDLNKKMVFK